MKQRRFTVGSTYVRTPLLVPSFSSKGFPEHIEMMQFLEEFISTPTLISAYDIHQQLVATSSNITRFNGVSLLIVDSGGYEANRAPEFAETPTDDYQPRVWTAEKHEAALAAFNTDAPVALVTYDHPDLRVPMDDQVRSATEFKALHPDAGIIFLLKPETTDKRTLDIDAIRRHIHALGDFAAIGVTEDEAGRSLTARMVFIAKLRKALDAAGAERTPIHIFGSLDTLLTCAYFVAGADIFDGLTWLRHAYIEEHTAYRRHYPVIEGLFSEPWSLSARKCWVHNYSRLQELQLAMDRAAASNDMTKLPRGEIIVRAFETMNAELGG